MAAALCTFAQGEPDRSICNWRGQKVVGPRGAWAGACELNSSLGRIIRRAALQPGRFVFSHPLRTLRPFRPVINRTLELLQPKPSPSERRARPSGAAEFTPLAPRHLQVLGSRSQSVSWLDLCKWALLRVRMHLNRRYIWSWPLSLLCWELHHTALHISHGTNLNTLPLDAKDASLFSTKCCDKKGTGKLLQLLGGLPHYQ